MVFQHQLRRLILSEMILAVLLLLVACNPAGSGNNSSIQGSTPSGTTATITPQLVTPKSASGSQGKGPVIVVTPSPVPNGPAGSQEVVLGDRTLIIYSAIKQKSASANSALINLNLAIQNTSGKAIMNQSTFFQLIGPEGDTFAYQYNSSDDFYGTITTRMIHRGLVVFQVPTAATSSMSLLYRPEVATETVIVQLKIS
ncbi:MAG: DUF4352 domain-containing protein [Ktedonobacteraceae bacterium]|jgi:hypothetical protein